MPPAGPRASAGWCSRLWAWEARLKGIELQGQVAFRGRPILQFIHGSRMVLGDGGWIASRAQEDPLGAGQPTVLRSWLPGAQLILGARVRLYGAVVISAVRVEVGEGTVLDWGAMVLDTDFHWGVGEQTWQDEDGSRARPVRIGRGVLVGARAIVMKGVTIGDRAQIRPGAVVTKDVAEGQVVAGNPARTV